MKEANTMNSTSTDSKPRLLMRVQQTFQRRRASVAFVAGVMLTAGLAGGMTALASESGPLVMHHGASAADVQAHVGAMLNHIDTQLSLSAEQKAHVDPLVIQALGDLMPMHQQLLQLHSQVQPLMMQSPIDRAALESLRAQHLALLDQASKRVTQLMADVGDQLTPAQRQQLWSHLGQMHMQSTMQLHGPSHGHVGG